MVWLKCWSVMSALGRLTLLAVSLLLCSAAPLLDLETAYRLCHLSSIAFCDPAAIQTWSCSRCRDVPDFTIVRVVQDLDEHLLAYVGTFQGAAAAAVVAFRGTDPRSLRNWVDDLMASKADLPYPPLLPLARIHSGFWHAWNGSSLRRRVTAAVAELLSAGQPPPQRRGAAAGAADGAPAPDAPPPPITRLYVTGHSLGAALAQLCALDVKLDLGLADVRLMTYGSPRVGDAAFAALLAAQLRDHSWRFTHNRDIVPSLPLTSMGFHHAAREVWVVDTLAGTLTPQQQQAGQVSSGGKDTASDSMAEPSGRLRPLGQAASRRRRLAQAAGTAEAGRRSSSGGAWDGDHARSRSTYAADAAAPLAAAAKAGSYQPQLRICDDSGEDPSCQRSVCSLLGVCTSFEDHLTYLGIGMAMDPEEC